MKKSYVFAVFAVFAAFLLSGCTALQTTAKGLAEKSVGASGLVSVQRAGLDKTTQTPELLSVLCWGDYASVGEGQEAVRYEVQSDASIFNSAAKSSKIKLFFASGDKERVDAALKIIADDVKTRKTE